MNDSTHQRSGKQLGIVIDGNLFVRPQSGGAIIGWDGTNKQVELYGTAASFASAAGLGASNVDVAQTSASQSKTAVVQTVGTPVAAAGRRLRQQSASRHPYGISGPSTETRPGFAGVVPRAARVPS